MKNEKKIPYEKPVMITVISETLDVIAASQGFNGDWDDLKYIPEPQDMIDF